MKTFIKNRHNQRVCAVVEGSEKSGRLAFVMHGLSGNKNELHIRSIAEAFLESGYTVVTFDTTNTFGESDGQYEDATLTGYYNDLEDVIVWAVEQPWYVEPFVLAGHSFGGMATSLFAEKYPEKVKALAPISSVISGELTLQTPKYNSQEMLDKWKKDGVWIFRGGGGTEKRLKWACMEDRLKYSLLPEVDKLTMPVLMVTGSEDDSTPPTHNQVLFDKLPGRKELHIIQGAVHTFNRASERDELKETVRKWLASLDRRFQYSFRYGNLQSSGITFIGTRTRHIDEMKQFAEQVLGYKKTHETDTFVAFTTPQGQRFELFSEDEADKQHFPLGVPVPGFEVPDFDAAVAWLHVNNLEVLGGIGEGESGTRWAHFRGPDGNIYEFVYHPTST